MRQIRSCWCGAIAEGNTDQCATHNAEDRRNARQATKTKVVHQTKKITEKRAGEMREYIKLKKQYLEIYPCCEVENCHLKSVDVHHKGGKENDLLTDATQFIALCRPHHIEFTNNSRKAINEGYSVSRTTKTE